MSGWLYGMDKLWKAWHPQIMMFDPPDYPYKDLSETLKEYGTDDLFQTIPTPTYLPEPRHEEELQSFNQAFSSTYRNQPIIQNNVLVSSQSNTTEFLIIQSENLLNFEPTLLDDKIVDQFLLPTQEPKEDQQGSENTGPDLLALHSCVLCHELFTTEADLLDHTILIHGSMGLENPVIPIATYNGVNNNDEFNNVMDTETIWMVCRMCERVLSTALEVEPTEKMCCIDENGQGNVTSQKLSTMYVCESCSGLFANGDALDRHKQICEKKNKETQYYGEQQPPIYAKETYKCHYCRFESESHEDMKRHFLLQTCRRSSQRKIEKRTYNGNTNNKMWNCGSCNQLFVTARDLYRHKRGEDRPEGAPLTAFVCDECDKVLGSMCALHTHRKMHKVTKPGYPCNICGRRFNQSGHLAIHMRMHTGERPYPCDLCPKAFKVKVERDDHRRTHTGERPFACTVCPKTFTAAARLREHARIHTDQRPYRCDVCGAAFRRPYARTVHTLIHTGEKPHECDVCGTAFRRSGDMWKHKRTIHCSQLADARS